MTRGKDLLRLDQIAQAIYDKKGFNILAIDVREFSSLTEYYIIAEGNVDKHVIAIAREIVDKQEADGHRAYHIEGLTQANWVVIDFGHIIVHILEPEFREKYALETLWRKGHVVDLKISVAKGELR